MSETSPTCVIIGPTKSGKTSLLGILQLATAKVAEQPARSLRILPASRDMVELIEFSNALENLGQLPGTLGIKRYVFDYEVTHKNRDRMFKQNVRTRFSMIDSPGGALLGDRKTWTNPEGMEEARAELVSDLKTAKYIMLCADSTDDASAAQFIQFLPGALSETGQERLPCEKLVICLTKADKYVVEHQSMTTRDEFAYEDPIKQVNRVIGRETIATLKMYLNDDVEIRAGWASVYGFDPETGRPNYDRETGGLLIDASTGASYAEILERWQPYRIEEPFIFLTAGLPTNLKKILPLGAHIPGIPRSGIFGNSSSRSYGPGSFFRKMWLLMKAFYDYIKFS